MSKNKFVKVARHWLLFLVDLLPYTSKLEILAMPMQMQ